ncbi:RagB/SusD family nutrient uptake outer membrane protein [Marinoscillum sp. MHG1-6]|uniref:RagB/SusD family nutrient uptake outer membrane protein n=1 Tax=Marinoscillum sp. MHG1-6 TaxID=2959627 RepID=UPI00215885B9|nr:RagB/SusD family nutrient uptake outer membrane protein [Marinoscillum sp. MHG1-6]
MKKIYIIAALAGMLISGCSEDFLDTQPLDNEVSSNFYQTEEDAMEALVAVYDALGYQSTPGVSWAPFQAVSDMLSDDEFAGGSDANDGKFQDELNNFNISTSNPVVRSLWMKNYVGIYRANLLLEKIGGIDASDEFKARVIAECKFMRAYFYFELVRFFENIPLMTSTIKGPSGYVQEQAEPADVYNQIALDLVEAAEDLPGVIPATEKGRISKWAAQSLLGRVYLFYNGVYGADLIAGDVTINAQAAADYLDDVIDNSGHDLMADYGDIFHLSGEFGIESVFEISYGDDATWWDWGYVRGGEGNLAAQQQGPRVTNSNNWDRGWSFGTVSEKLAADMTGDPRFQHTILTEGELDGDLAYGYQHTGYFNKKYSSDAEHQSAGGQFELNRTCNYRVIRFSDVLLMAAELGSPNAQDHLDRVRARVGLGSVPVNLDNIYNERRMELALEGIRYFDVIRRGMSYADAQLSSSGVRGTNYVGDQQIFDVSFNSSTNGFLPIPQEEMDIISGTFTQNTGY